MENYLVMWPKSSDVIHINYHYTQFGEIIDYLKKHMQNQIIAIDCDVQNYSIMDIINDKSIKKVVMNVNYENVSNAFKLADEIKKKIEIPILAYGSIPIMHPQLFLNSSFDSIFQDGDSEICIESFLKNYRTDAEITDLKKDLKGNRIIKNGSFINTNPGEYILSSEWGSSRQKDVPVKEYDKIKKKNRYVINISRGCPFGCSHCLIQLSEGKKERRRDIKNIKETLEEIEADYSHLKIWAANFTLDKNYVYEFCEMMRQYFPKMTWECATRIDLVRDIKMLNRMHESGCTQISLGIEGLRNGDMIETKNFNILEISRAIYGIQSSGIKVKGCVMLGMPNQTKEDIIATLRFLKNNNVIIRPTIYTPYHKLPKDVNKEILQQYNRKTYQNHSIKGVNCEQLIRLVNDPYNYEEILYDSRDKENIEER